MQCKSLQKKKRQKKAKPKNKRKWSNDEAQIMINGVIFLRTLNVDTHSHVKERGALSTFERHQNEMQ